MTPPRLQHGDPLRLIAKLPLRQQIAALGQALVAGAPDEHHEIAMRLIELASFGHPSDHTGGHTIPDSADSPLELLARIPRRWHARHAQEAMLAIARAWGGLSTPMKELGVGLGRDRWLGAARTLAKDPDPRARSAALAIAHDTADPGFGKVVGSLLADEHQAVRKAADKAMMRMTMVMLDHLPAHLLGEQLAEIAATPQIALPADEGVLELERCILLSAIADAAWSFASHRCRSPLLAALLVMDRAIATPMERELCARMRRLLSERNHPSHSPMRTVLRRTPCPILRERALRWITIAPISSAAIDRLSSAESLEEHEIVLCKAHLAIRPARSIRLSTLHHTTIQKNGRLELSSSGPLPEREKYDQLSIESRLGMIRLASLITIDDQARRNLLEPTLADPNARIRLNASAVGSSIDLPDFLFDINESVARHAALRWSSLGFTPPRAPSKAWSRRNEIARINARSPHAWVRRVAREETDRITIRAVGSPASRVQARRLYHHDPSGFVRTIRDQLANPSQCCDALLLIQIMGIEHRFELDLIALIQSESSDPKVKATVVKALGAIETNSANYILLEALSDGDDRIRANAAESIRGSIEQIIELKSDPHHRVRASAIRRVIAQSDPSCLAITRSAGDSLLEMLCDDRPMHRLAATWAAQRTMILSRREVMGVAWKPLINEIESLAANDLDQRIRSRAKRCIHRLGADIANENESHLRELHRADWGNDQAGAI